MTTASDIGNGIINLKWLYGLLKIHIICSLIFCLIHHQDLNEMNNNERVSVS